MKKKPTNNNGGWKGKKNDTPSSSKPNYSNNNNVNDVWAVDNQKHRTARKRREFTPIGMSYDTTFDRLHSRGLVTPIGPIRDPEPEKRSPTWNPNANCKYHQGRGHSTENCWKLKEVIQNLIDTNKLPVPPASKRASINTSPLSAALSIYQDQVSFDPSQLITHIDEPMVVVAYLDRLE